MAKQKGEPSRGARIRESERLAAEFEASRDPREIAAS